MNKYIFTIAVTCLALLNFGQVASAHEEDEDNPSAVYRNHDPQYNDPRYDRQERFERGGRLQSELEHLKGMLIHVDREMRTYRADRQTWGQYRHLREEAEQLKNQLRRGEQYYNRGRVLAEIEHMHGELHQIELQLHTRANDWYRWR